MIRFVFSTPGSSARLRTFTLKSTERNEAVHSSRLQHLTAYHERVPAVEAWTGKDPFLQKPFTDTGLIKKVEDVLANKQADINLWATPSDSILLPIGVVVTSPPISSRRQSWDISRHAGVRTRLSMHCCCDGCYNVTQVICTQGKNHCLTRCVVHSSTIVDLAQHLQ